MARREPRQEGVLQSIRYGRTAQDKKWGKLKGLKHLTDKDMLAILMEEVGEVASACMDHRGNRHPSCLINKELIQVAAVAVKWMEIRALKGEGAASWTPGHPGFKSEVSNG